MVILEQFNGYVNLIMERLIPRRATKRGAYKNKNRTRGELLPRRVTHSQDGTARHGKILRNVSRSEKGAEKRNVMLVRAGLPPDLVYGKRKGRQKRGSKTHARDQKANWRNSNSYCKWKSWDRNI